MVLSFYKPRAVRPRVEEQPHERQRHTIQDPKMMVTSAWNPMGLHSLDAVPKDNTFNVEDYRINILTEFLPVRPHVDGRRLVIHAGNARAHTARKYQAFCEENRLRLAVRPAYSPDLAPSDFFSSDRSNIVCRESLSNYVKSYLQQFMKSSEPSSDQPWRTCFGTGWRDLNGLLRTMVTNRVIG
jgi:transposase